MHADAANNGPYNSMSPGVDGARIRTVQPEQREHQVRPLGCGRAVEHPIAGGITANGIVDGTIRADFRPDKFS